MWDGKRLYDLYDWAHTPWEWHSELFKKAKDIGITIFSSPFDKSAVEFLEKLNCPCYKVASFEVIDHNLIECMAKTGKPMIVSTGMANLQEIKEAVEVIEKHHKNYVLLHCVSGYPTPHSESNILTLMGLRENFDCFVGLSDHTLGTATSVASVALGAKVIEKHFIESREDKGPDSEFSLEPHELKILCSDTKIAWESLGNSSFDRKNSEKQNVKFRRSLYFVKSLNKGETVSEENVKSIRPGYGLAPKQLKSIIGKKVNSNIEKGTPVSLDLLV